MLGHTGHRWQGTGNVERPRASNIRSERCERPPTLHSVAVYCVLERFSAHFPHISAHFPGFSHFLRTFSVVSAIFRTFPEKILSYPQTVLKFWYKNRFVSRKPPAAHVPRAERQERHPPPSRSERTFLRKRTRSLTTMID